MLRRILVVTVACAACGDNITGLPLAALDGELLHARCERFTRCGLFVDEPSCEAFFRPHPDLDLAAALDDDTVLYDGASAAGCVAALAALPCDESTRDVRVLPRACEDMFAGTRATGEDCALSEECRSGSCDIPKCPDACCRGTCRDERRTAELGEPCVVDDDCIADAFCSADGSCRPLGAEGATCDSDRQCAFGSGCIGASELMQGNCRALPLIGASCPYMRCAEVGAACVEGTCVAVGLPGAPCTTDSECSEFAFCDTAAGACARVPALGEPCTGLCAGEAWCDIDTSQRCEPPKPNTTPCFSNDQCASLYCEEGAVFDSCADAPLCF